MAGFPKRATRNTDIHGENPIVSRADEHREPMEGVPMRSYAQSKVGGNYPGGIGGFIGGVLVFCFVFGGVWGVWVFEGLGGFWDAFHGDFQTPGVVHPSSKYLWVFLELQLSMIPQIPQNLDQWRDLAVEKKLGEPRKPNTFRS